MRNVRRLGEIDFVKTEFSNSRPAEEYYIGSGSVDLEIHAYLVREGRDCLFC